MASTRTSRYDCWRLRTQRGQGPWIVIVEPDAEAGLVVVVTVYEVSQ